MEAQKPTNILFITSDQQHWSMLGAHRPGLRTPCLDQLASQGTRFDRAYCPNPTCTPTRASLITGLYPSQHGAYSLGTKLSEQVPTIGDYLQSAGYDTALIGKAHFQPLQSTPEYPSLEAYPLLQDLDYWRAFNGPFYGFNHVELARPHGDEPSVGQHYALWLEGKGVADWRKYFQPPTGTTEAQQHHWNIPAELHPNSWIAERTCARLDDRKEDGKPFFMWASFFDPHPPYVVPEPWDTAYDPAEIEMPSLRSGEHDGNPEPHRLTQVSQPDFSAWEEPEGNTIQGYHSHLHDRAALAKDIAIYHGMTEFMDQQIGRILDHLEATGQAENTLVVFTSDHGHLFGQHGLIAKGPFHYEDLLRVPFIARWPGRIPAGRVSGALQSLVDVPTSFLAASGQSLPRSMAGLDQTPVWTGAVDSVRDHVLVENRHQPTKLQLHTYVDDRYKLTAYHGHDHGELFDLHTDPDEQSNRWDDPAARELKARLLLRLAQAEMSKEPRFMPRVCPW